MTVRVRDEGGFTMVEILVANVLLWGALLGLAAASVLAATQVRQGDQNVKTSLVAQEAMEALYAQEGEDLENGSDSIAGTYVSWTVSGTSLVKVVMVVEHRLSDQSIRPDTFVTYVVGDDDDDDDD